MITVIILFLLHWPESDLHGNSFVNTYPYRVQMVLVKTDRQGIRYLCELRCLMYGSETWPMNAEHETKLSQTEK